MAGLFDTFNIGKRGLNVNQSAINTTSHNIANANTKGYSRQRSVVETTRPFGGMSRFDTCSAGQVGTGADVTKIQRIRDEFKDYQVRNQKTEYGALNLKNRYLTQVEDILNETSDKGLQQALSDFYKGFQSLSLAPDKSSNRTVAIKNAATLASALNNRYMQLENKKNDAQLVLQNDVANINSILDQINNLNKQITGVSAIGMSPNDLMDKRDNLLDELSTKFGITKQKQKYESLDVSSTELPGIGKLVDGTNFTGTNTKRFSCVQSANLDAAGNLTITYSILGDSNNTETITIAGADEALKNEVLEKRILIAGNDGRVTPEPTDRATLEAAMFKVEKGEIGGIQSVQKNIQKCMDDLDKFAAGLAYSVNAIQTGSTNGTANPNLANNDPLFITKGTTSDTGISAKTIMVNSTIEDDVMKLNCGVTETDVSGDKAGTRALAIANIINLKMDLTKIDVTATSTKEQFFQNTATAGSGLSFENADNLNLKGSLTGATLDNFYKSKIGDLAIASKAVSKELDTAGAQMQVFENDRLSESGVSIDEETTNLIQFQHAYQANAKLISTVDELLDVVINGLKR